jgi:hypothetical protein
MMYIYTNNNLFVFQTGSGSTYVIWGRKQCPPNNYTEQVYSGIVLLLFPLNVEPCVIW